MPDASGRDTPMNSKTKRTKIITKPTGVSEGVRA